MIDIESETPIDFKQAAAHPAYRNPRNGKPAHVASIYRHITRGVVAANGQRIRLEAARTSSGLKTSREAIMRFVARLTDPDASTTPEPSHNHQRAEAALEAAGI